VVQGAAQNGRWEGVLRLGRAVEGPLAVRGHWGAWAETLEWELEAARQLGDRAAKAWSLHQSGTRALCLEDTPTARRDLSEALRLRESLGDREGAAVTRHNLNLLGGFGGNNGPEGNGSGGGMGGLGRWPLIVGTIVVVAILGFMASALGRGEGIFPTSSGNEPLWGGEQPGGREIHATDAARREAKERGLDLTPIEGTGPNGRITVDDVKKAAKAAGQGGPGGGPGGEPGGGAQPGDGGGGTQPGDGGGAQPGGGGGTTGETTGGGTTGPTTGETTGPTGTTGTTGVTCANNGIDDNGDGQIDEEGDCATGPTTSQYSRSR
jgi:hypothetical protein